MRVSAPIYILSIQAQKKVYSDDHGYDENVFEYQEYMDIFLQNYQKYTALYSEWKHISADDLYIVSTRCIQTIIEMNSRAGQFNYINGTIQSKKSLLEQLYGELEFYQQVNYFAKFVGKWFT